MKLTQQLTLENCPLSLGRTILQRINEAHINSKMLAFAINEKYDVLNNIISDKTNLTPELALKLSVFFGTNPDFWFRTEYKYKLYLAKNNKDLVDRTLNNITPVSQGFKEFDPDKYRREKEYKPYNIGSAATSNLY